MLGVQRHVTAVMAFAVAMVLAAGCGSARGSDLALTGAENPPADGPSTSLFPATTVADATVDDGSAPGDDVSSSSVATDGTGPSALSAGTDDGPAPSSSTPVPASSPGDVDAASLLRQVDSAVEHQDICQVYAGLARVQLTTSATDRLIAQLTRIRDIMVAASGFAPSDLSADWSTLTDGTADMVDSLQQEQDVKASAATHYDEDDYRSASRRVEAWMGRNCA